VQLTVPATPKDVKNKFTLPVASPKKSVGTEHEIKIGVEA